jgi:hypothetical protein
MKTKWITIYISKEDIGRGMPAPADEFVKTAVVNSEALGGRTSALYQEMYPNKSICIAKGKDAPLVFTEA